jgi:ADP-heptose:LPS heptosyltransferase
MPVITENVKKIAILRANGLGDFIVSLPAIKAIRSTYPAAEIILLGRLWHKEFLEKKRTPVDRVIVVPVSKGIREEQGMQQDKGELDHFFSEMQKEKFDIAIHFQGRGIAANPFIKKLGARFSIGLSSVDSAPLDRSTPFFYYQSEVIRYLEVAALIGAKPDSLEPELKVLAADTEEADRFLENSGDLPYVILHPSASDPRRAWPAEKYVQIGNELARKNFQVIFTGNEQERVVISSIIEEMSFPALNSGGKLSLDGLTGILAGSTLVISGDTGPLHLARAVGARTVGIYWAPNLINWGPLTRTHHRPVVSWDLQCPICGIIPNNPYPFEPEVAGCRHLVSFVKKITVKEVLEQAEELLRSGKKIFSRPGHTSIIYKGNE